METIISCLESMISFLKEYAATLIALIALFRPELFGWIFMKFSKIEFYKSGRLEIGFSGFGPTIGINGTLRSYKSDQFISNITIKLTRSRDSATYNFLWTAFREINILNPQSTKIDIASPFLLKTVEAKQINILLSDTSTKDRFTDACLKLKESFERFLRERKYFEYTEIRAHIEEFRDTKPPEEMEAYTAVSDNIYWEVGEYTFDLSIVTDKKTFSFKYKFNLNQSDVENIKNNSIAILQEAKSAEVRYNFSYPEYYEVIN